MVLSVMPVGDYDKRVVLLTKERGKITAFAKGARRQNSALLASCNPFSFGEFTLFEGTTAYRIVKTYIHDYFAELRNDIMAAYYGMYFLELADYYARENSDEKMLLQLLYLTLKAIIKGTIEYELIQYIYELKVMVINGEYPQVFECVSCRRKEKLCAFDSKSGGALCSDCRDNKYHKNGNKDSIQIADVTLYTLQFIIASKLPKLYTFTLAPAVFNEFKKVMEQYKGIYLDKRFKTLSILQQLR